MAKVMLSELEAALVNNSEWILTKHTVIQKAGDLLAAQVPVINEKFIAALITVLPGLDSCRPKISKGERYLDLPYVILDYPARFSKTDVFALRTMFWWGNFISVTLQLSGNYKKIFESTIAQQINEPGPSLYISTGKEEWAHHFEEDNYQKAGTMDKEMLRKKIVQPSFIKVALQYDLRQWNDMNDLLQTAYNRMALLLKP